MHWGIFAGSLSFLISDIYIWLSPSLYIQQHQLYKLHIYVYKLHNINDTDIQCSTNLRMTSRHSNFTPPIFLRTLSTSNTSGIILRKKKKKRKEKKSDSTSSQLVSRGTSAGLVTRIWNPFVFKRYLTVSHIIIIPLIYPMFLALLIM